MDTFIYTNSLKSQKHYVYGVINDLLLMYRLSYLISTQAYKPKGPAKKKVQKYVKVDITVMSLLDSDAFN